MEITFENRAWRGLRLVSDKVIIGRQAYVFEIGFHFTIGKFGVDVEITYLDRNPPETYGCWEFFSQSLTECLDWINKKYGLTVKLRDPWDVIQKEADYDVSEYKKLHQKVR